MIGKPEWFADLPAAEFTQPEGIVTEVICSVSGLLPIPGLCDGHLREEVFAEGTEPLASCDMHYSGMICAYDQLPASAECPFQTPGICTLPHIEDVSLLEGSSTLLPDGTVVQPNLSTQCQHDVSFYINPDYEAVLNEQQWQLNTGTVPPH